MAYSAEQRRIARLIVAIGQHQHAKRKEIVSALETGLVESNLRNLRGGDGSSVGWRQETASSYPGVNRRNVRQSIKRYYRETAAQGRGRGQTAGQLAAAVQRPQAQYRGRYGQQRGTALHLFRALTKGGSLGGGGGGLTTTTTTTSGVPGVTIPTRQSPTAGTTAIADLLQQQLEASQPAKPAASPLTPPAVTAMRNLHVAGPVGAQQLPAAGGPAPPQDVSSLIQSIATAGAQQPGVQHSSLVSAGSPGTSVTSVAGGGGKATIGPHGVPRGTRHLKGVAHFDGQPVAAWIKPWLVYARKHGWKGSVGSGWRSFADQTKIYNSGKRPAAKPGTSNHEGSDFPRGAVDVTQAAELSAILRRAGSPLKWAGAKDNVHFSHPHNGSY